MGYQMVTCPMTSHNPQRCCEAVWSAVLATALLVFLYFLVSFLLFCFLSAATWIQSMCRPVQSDPYDVLLQPGRQRQPVHLAADVTRQLTSNSLPAQVL